MPEAVRRAVAADAARLHRIAALTFPLACTPYTLEQEKAAHIAQQLSEAAFVEHLSDPARLLFVAVDEDEDANGEALGYTMLVTDQPTDPDVIGAIRLRPTVELSRVYVHPDRHGSGTADRLMAATLDAARATGAAGVWLGVSEENARANAFYARHGFVQVGRKRFHIGARWEDDLVRERAL